MVQKINPHLAPGYNRSPPPTMYFQKMQFLGVFHPLLQRSLTDVVHSGVYCVVGTSPLFSVFSSLEGRKKDSFLGFPG